MENTISQSTLPLAIACLEPFGVGGRRKCYVHPNHEDRCVKTLRKDKNRTVRLKKKTSMIPRALRREHDNNESERKVLVRIEQRMGARMREHLPMCYGYSETDEGPGLVLDLIRDANGQISRSLRELITLGHQPDEFKSAFDEFSKFLLANSILTRNLHDHNMVAKRLSNDSWKLYLIDGVGDPAWLPLARWSKTLAKKKIQKRIDAAWPRIEQFAKVGGVTEKMRKNSTWDQGLLRHR